MGGAGRARMACGMQQRPSPASPACPAQTPCERRTRATCVMQQLHSTSLAARHASHAAPPHYTRRRRRASALRAYALSPLAHACERGLGSWAQTMGREDERRQTVIGQLVPVLVAHAVKLPEALVYAIVAGGEVLAEHEGVVMAGRRHVLRHHSCAQSALCAQLVPIVLHAPAAPGLHAPQHLALSTSLAAPMAKVDGTCDAGMQTRRRRTCMQTRRSRVSVVVRSVRRTTTLTRLEDSRRAPRRRRPRSRRRRRGARRRWARKLVAARRQQSA